MLIAPNHFSFLDHFFVAAYLRRKVQFMAKSQLFTRPMQWMFTHGGVFPMLRGRHDDEAFKTAHTILGRGDMVLMYLEGGRSRTGELGEPKPGVGRLALESGVPVVPTAIVGSAKVRNWTRLQFPKVTVQFGDPDQVRAGGAPHARAGAGGREVVFAEVEKLYYGLQQQGRKRAIRAARGPPAGGQAAARRPPRQLIDRAYGYPKTRLTS